jgi:hypothetical protein
MARDNLVIGLAKAMRDRVAREVTCACSVIFKGSQNAIHLLAHKVEASRHSFSPRLPVDELEMYGAGAVGWPDGLRRRAVRVPLDLYHRVRLDGKACHATVCGDWGSP